jgi:four helix bundle protein
MEKSEGRFKKEEKKKDLRERTKSFAIRIIRMYSHLPKSMESQVIGRQVLRSGTSVGANYREAYRSRSRAEFAAKAGDCLKELEETSYWLELLVESDIISEKLLSDLRNEANELTGIFVTIIKKTKQKGKE